MTLLSGSTEADINAAPEACWAVVQDVARWAEWQQGIESVAVVETDDHGRVLVCDTVLDAKVKKIGARVRISYDEPRRLDFTRVQSDDFDEMHGSWELAPAGAGTHAVYTLAVDPGKVGFMGRALEKALRPIVVGRRAEELGREVAARG
jgi:ribosome-associated toxin RatA of RatAB toxin-antitoxin module